MFLTEKVWARHIAFEDLCFKGRGKNTDMDNFYDEVAKKFGGYDLVDDEPEHTSEYPSGDPDEIFKEKIRELADSSLTALDIGCGDGTFSFNIADRFAKIVGLDSSKELLRIAKQRATEHKSDNLEFVFGDAAKTPFGNGSFDIIFNRRGPSFYDEYARLLKEDGHYVEIGIGEKDAMELKQAFGRGQNYGSWDQSRLEQDKSKFERAGVNVIFARDFFYSESYASGNEFERFLKRVPIFEDFDPVEDRKFLDTYFLEHLEGPRVKLNRHRVVYVVQK